MEEFHSEYTEIAKGQPVVREEGEPMVVDEVINNSDSMKTQEIVGEAIKRVMGEMDLIGVELIGQIVERFEEMEQNGEEEKLNDREKEG
jgi:hypothetical protein